MLLKKGVTRGLTPRDIGKIMCRKGDGKNKSVIELVLCEVENVVPRSTSEKDFLRTVSKTMDLHLDKRFPNVMLYLVT